MLFTITFLAATLFKFLGNFYPLILYEFIIFYPIYFFIITCAPIFPVIMDVMIPIINTLLGFISTSTDIHLPKLCYCDDKN